MKKIIILSLMTCISLTSFAQSKSSDKTAPPVLYDVVIGTYTNKYPASGIYVYQFNSQTGEFLFKTKTEGVSNPSYLAVSADRKFVYSVSEGSEATISAFAFNPVSGKLKYLNNAPTGGNGPCYVSVDDQNKYVFAANYGGGSFSAIGINADGSLRQDVQTFQNEGSSVVKGRQDGPHVHSAVLSLDNKYAFVPDLGTDKINIYKVDVTQEKPLTPASPAFFATQPGKGPRHFTFHPNGKYAYVILELTAEILAMEYKDGKLTEKQTVAMTAPDFKGAISGADIHVSPDGKFVYGTNRGDANEIVAYAIGKDGQLTFVARQSTLGKIPRNFAIDPTGNFILVANQNTDDIFIFKRDQKTGVLSETGKRMLVGQPVCLKFVAAN